VTEIKKLMINLSNAERSCSEKNKYQIQYHGR